MAKGEAQGGALEEMQAFEAGVQASLHQGAINFAAQSVTGEDSPETHLPEAEIGSAGIGHEAANQAESKAGNEADNKADEADNKADEAGNEPGSSVASDAGAGGASGHEACAEAATISNEHAPYASAHMVPGQTNEHTDDDATYT